MIFHIKVRQTVQKVFQFLSISVCSNSTEEFTAEQRDFNKDLKKKSFPHVTLYSVHSVSKSQNAIVLLFMKKGQTLVIFESQNYLLHLKE